MDILELHRLFLHRQIIPAYESTVFIILIRLVQFEHRIKCIKRSLENVILIASSSLANIL